MKASKVSGVAKMTEYVRWPTDCQTVHSIRADIRLRCKREML
jgi:hypothetical protein